MSSTETRIPLSKKGRDMLRREKIGGESYDEALRRVLTEWNEEPER